MAGELARGLDLRPHGAGGEAEFFHVVRVGLGDGFLGWLAEVYKCGADVGGDYQQITFQLFGQQRRAQVLVDQRFHAFEFSAGAVHRWNAATASTDHDAALIQQPLDRADFEDAFWPWAGNHTAILVAIRGNRPTFFGGEYRRVVASPRPKRIFE